MEISLNTKIQPSSHRPYHPAKSTKEYYALTSYWHLFDEVVFIIKQNLRGNAISAFIAAIPKLSLIFAIFTKQVNSPGILILLAVMHQFFWRPIAWMALSSSFLAGFPDRRVRSLSKQDYSWHKYGMVCLANMLTAITFSGILALAILTYMGKSPTDGYEFPALIAWFFMWWYTLTVTPALLLRKIASQKDKPFFPNGKLIMTFKLSARFSMLLATLYLVLVGSSNAIFNMLGLQASYLGISEKLLFVSFVIAADCLIDPFIIGFRILLCKFCMEQCQND